MHAITRLLLEQLWVVSDGAVLRGVLPQGANGFARGGGQPAVPSLYRRALSYLRGGPARAQGKDDGHEPAS